MYLSRSELCFRCSPQLSGLNPEIKKLHDLDCRSGCSGYLVMNMSIFWFVKLEVIVSVHYSEYSKI